MTLTIAIPTFNRMAQLERVLRRLAPQLDDRCDILVLDNASAIPVAPMVADVLPAGTGVRVLRHRTNIGAHANIHRAIELAEGKWVWVLGDDDLPTEDAIARIFAAIDADTSAVFINFTTTLVAARHERPATLRSTGLDAFIEILDLPNSLNFMSSSVWKTEPMLPQLRLAYHYAYSMSWVFAFLLPMVADGASVVLHADPIIDQMTMVEEGGRWSFVNFVLGFPTVLESPMSARARRRLALKLLRSFGPEHIAGYLLAGLRNADVSHARWMYRLTTGRLNPYFTFPQRVRLLAYTVLFLSPRLSWKVVRLVIVSAVAIGLKGVSITDLESRSADGARL